MLLTGCSIVGPTAIRNGRLLYNEAISQTNSEQMLLAVIHNRYMEEISMLMVSSVTANVQIVTRADVQLGFGDDGDYSGNLVPFSAGTIYEENPTISYTPASGARYMSQLSAPIPIAVLARLSGVAHPAPVYGALIASVNGIRNPDFLYESERADPRFERAITLMARLVQVNRLHWIGAPGKAEIVSLVLVRDEQEEQHEVDELLQLLGLPLADHPGTIEIPVSLALHGRDSGGIGITTRSVVRLGEILSAAVEVPSSDLDTGVAADYPPRGPAGADLRIRYSRSKPDLASVAVPYRDGWFYIDDRDQATKRFFRILVALWSAALADASAHGAAAPVLTVPVSR